MAVFFVLQVASYSCRGSTSGKSKTVFDRSFGGLLIQAPTSRIGTTLGSGPSPGNGSLSWRSSASDPGISVNSARMSARQAFSSALAKRFMVSRSVCSFLLPQISPMASQVIMNPNGRPPIAAEPDAFPFAAQDTVHRSHLCSKQVASNIPLLV